MKIERSCIRHILVEDLYNYNDKVYYRINKIEIEIKTKGLDKDLEKIFNLLLPELINLYYEENISRIRILTKVLSHIIETNKKILINKSPKFSGALNRITKIKVEQNKKKVLKSTLKTIRDGNEEGNKEGNKDYIIINQKIIKKKEYQNFFNL